MADDPQYEGTFACRSIDVILTSLEDALSEANSRLQAENNLEVTISKQEMTGRYKEMYETKIVKDPKTGKSVVKDYLGKTIGAQG